MVRSSSTELVLSLFETVCGANRTMPAERDMPTAALDTSKATNRMEAFWIRLLHNAFRDLYCLSRHPNVIVLSKAYRDLAWRRMPSLPGAFHGSIQME